MTCRDSSTTHSVLVASCLGEQSGGGLCQMVNGQLVNVDSLSTTGIAANERLFVRLAWSDREPSAPSSVIRYYLDGRRTETTLSLLQEPHSVVISEASLVVVSTFTNSLLWLSEDDQITRAWRAPGRGDSWHLNSIVHVENRLYVSAFGAFSEHRGWEKHKTDGSGFVFALDSGERLITGLDCPHNPLPTADGSWLICNSAREELLQVDPATQRIIRRAQLRGWTRGLACSESEIFVGESAHRLSSKSGGVAHIAVLDRHTWSVIDRLPATFSEIYDLTWISEDLLRVVASAEAGERLSRRGPVDPNLSPPS